MHSLDVLYYLMLSSVILLHYRFWVFDGYFIGIFLITGLMDRLGDHNDKIITLHNNSNYPYHETQNIIHNKAIIIINMIFSLLLSMESMERLRDVG